MTGHPVPLDNHVYVAGQVGYQNNSAPAAYNLDAARRELDALGWKLNGKVREKDGRQLAIRDVFFDAQIQPADRLGRTAEPGADRASSCDLDPKPGTGFFSQYIRVGDFDIAQFGWVGGAFPLSALPQIYTSDGDSNFGKIGNARIDAKIDETLSQLDEGKARVLANEVDRMIWEEGFSLPLFQTSGDIAVRSDVANFGAFGLADVVYSEIGFTRD